MISLQKTIRQTLTVLLTFGAVELAALCKMSYLVGSWASFFSATAIAVPLVGILGGTGFSSGLTGLRALVRWLVLGSNPTSFLVYHIPGIVAAFYWRSSLRMVKVGIPAVCMALFIAHSPAAWLYTLYWLIPIGIYCFNRESVFEKSLAASFVAHAVGSVIWLYTIPMTIELWDLLIPVVVIERLAFASGIALAYYGAYAVAIRYHAYWKKIDPSLTV
ncbi:MAG: hypothetical protein WD068_03355 [Candidatus Babeliales bacterium]